MRVWSCALESPLAKDPGTSPIVMVESPMHLWRRHPITDKFSSERCDGQSLSMDCTCVVLCRWIAFPADANHRVECLGPAMAGTIGNWGRRGGGAGSGGTVGSGTGCGWGAEGMAEGGLVSAGMEPAEGNRGRGRGGAEGG